MTRRIRIIGIGAGNPEHMTIQAINALNTCDALFVPTKGDEKSFLAEIRHEICARFITGEQPRMLHFVVPDRRRDGVYEQGVADWHDAVAKVYEDLLTGEVGEDDTVGLLVWGDPMLYDGTIRTMDYIRGRGRVAFYFDVIPGISSLQTLCAQHRIPLNRIGGNVQITTGRRLAQGWPEGVNDVAVMLDAVKAYEAVDIADAEIFWGGYVGTPMEVLISGRLADVAGEISRTREAVRKEHGWLMDSYVIRRPAGDGGEE